MIRILGTTRNEFFSNLIRRITSEDISHVAIQIGDFVIHSNRKGVVYEKLSTFLELNKVIVSITPKKHIHSKVLTRRIQEKLPRYIGRKYDQLAIAFMAIRFMLRLWFSIPLPKDNLWNVSNMYICTELVNDIADLEFKADMLTPMGLIEEAIATKYWTWEKKLDIDA